MSATLDQLIDETWDSMRGNLFRRAILGKKRCAELVMHAVASFPDREFKSLNVRQDSDVERQVIKDVERRVAQRYTATGQEPGTYGYVFLSLVLYWAISAIVQYLVVQWWKRHFDAESIRREYGWK